MIRYFFLEISTEKMQHCIIILQIYFQMCHIVEKEKVKLCRETAIHLNCDYHFYSKHEGVNTVSVQNHFIL